MHTLRGSVLESLPVLHVGDLDEVSGSWYLVSAQSSYYRYSWSEIVDGTSHSFSATLFQIKTIKKKKKKKRKSFSDLSSGKPV